MRSEETIFGDRLQVVLRHTTIGKRRYLAEYAVYLFCPLFAQVFEDVVIEHRHHVEDIVPQIDRVVLVRDGRIAADGPKRDLMTAETLGELFDIPVQVEQRGGEYRLW